MSDMNDFNQNNNPPAPGAPPPVAPQPGPPAQSAPQPGPPAQGTPGGGLTGIVASSAVYAQQQVQQMVSQGIGTGGYSDLNYYDWVTASEYEHRMNPQAGENLLWVLPIREGEPQLGRPEASHWMQHLTRSFRCVASMFPQSGQRCPICDAIQAIQNTPGVDTNRMGAQWRYNLCVVDYKNPQNHVQVVTLSDRLYMQIYQTLANEGLPEGDRDFTNPFAGRPWQIIRTKTKKGKIKYSAQLYPITPMPMASDASGGPDLAMIQYWIDSCPKLWDIIKEPSETMMTEIATVAYDLQNYWLNRPTGAGQAAQPQMPNYGAPSAPPPTAGPPIGQPAPAAGYGPPPGVAGPPPGVPGPPPGVAGPPPGPPAGQPAAAPPAAPGPPPSAAGPPPAAPGPPPADPGAPPAAGQYNPELMPPTAAPGSPGYQPPPPTVAGAAPGGSAPPGMGDQSPPPPPGGMPGQTPAQSSQPIGAATAPGATADGRMACFGTYDGDRLMCQDQCKDKTTCIEQTPNVG